MYSIGQTIIVLMRDANVYLNKRRI